MMRATVLPPENEFLVINPGETKRIPVGPGRGLVVSGANAYAFVELRIGDRLVGYIPLGSAAMPHMVLVPYDAIATISAGSENENEGGLTVWTMELASGASDGE